MVNAAIWFIVFAACCSCVLWCFVRKYYTSFIITATALGIGIGISFASVLVVRMGATNDTEIVNGKITEKVREHDTYERSYKCRCRTNSKGTETCSTCYETRYTVEWIAKSTVGDFKLKSLDRSSRSVYLTPDPDIYTRIGIGEPASAKRTYTNYVQAIPESLYTPTSKAVRERLAKHIPSYPDTIYDRWKNDHVVSADTNIADLNDWNLDVANALRDVGPEKQVNLIFMVTSSNDPAIEFAVRDAWDNGNKNDVIVIVGAPNYPQVEFVRILTWSKNELFKIELADAVVEYGKADKGLVPIAIKQINKNFERRKMKEFEYLSNEISMPMWGIILVLCLIMAATFGVYFYRDKF